MLKHSIGYFLFVCVAIVWQPVWSQVVFDFSEGPVIARMATDVYTLASDEMEGREAGTEGERKAAEYIKVRMKQAGLQPLFDGSYYQEFPFPGEWVWGIENSFTYMDHTFEHGVDYYVLPGSSGGSFSAPFIHVGYGLTGMTGVEGYEDYCDYALHADVEGRFFVMEFYVPQPLDTISDRRLYQLLFRKIGTAVEKGAAGIVFVNTKSGRDDPPMDLRMARMQFDIPILFAEPQVLHALMDVQEGDIVVDADIYREDHTGINVAGYIDNNAPYTVVIGAHYDHVGYGGSGSRSQGEHAIHPGADDNASGTAGMLEAARYISSSTLQQHNYLFIGFSAEEKGLIGSRYFTGSDAYDIDRINYMFNFDMIGRLNEKTLTMIGTGTSPKWDELIDSHAPDHFNIRKSPGGRGGSDHTSFYLKGIPVLFFFTGIHEDYHRPGDTADKINYDGARDIVFFGLDMIKTLDGMDRLAFTTASAGEPSRPRTQTVALGLMPDHAFEGEGLRVMSVSDDRPAQKAGIQDGDVIIRINDKQVLEIHTYMEAMGTVSAGDKIEVTIIRDEEEHCLEVAL